MTKFRRFVLLVTLLVVCLGLLTLQTRGYGGSAVDAVALVTTPVQVALAAVPRAALGAWSAYRDWKNVRVENRRLREENRSLRVDALWVTDAIDENRRLRRLLDLRNRLPVATLAGEVIARDWGGWVRSLTVNRGRGDDVKRLTAVISTEGLVGRIVEVRPGASIVQVLTDPSSTVGAHALRTRTPGIVEGEPRGTIRFKYMARDGAGIAVDDVIVTSGLGGLFPRGIPVGRVRAIDDRGSALFHYALLAPVVDFARVDEVLLVSGEALPDFTTAFLVKTDE
jgi:rod shape-determining protein MreC